MSQRRRVPVPAQTFAAFKSDKNGNEQLAVGPRDGLRPYEPLVQRTVRCIPTIIRFSPDGSKILFWKMCDENAIFVMPTPAANGKGATPRQLFKGKLDGQPVGATWYADRRHIVFASHGSLWLGDSETEALTRLTTGTTPTHWPDVGRDGTVAFAEEIVDFDVVDLPLAGGTPRALVSSTLYDGAAAWTPSGAAFAYVADRGAGEEIRVRSTADSSEQRLLTVRDFPEIPGRIRALTYSPDGRWLAMSVLSSMPTFHAGIWIMPAGGGTPRLITPKEALAGHQNRASSVTSNGHRRVNGSLRIGGEAASP